MSNELKTNIQIAYNNGLVSQVNNLPNLAVTVSSPLLQNAVAAVTTSAGALDLGAVTAPGYVIVRNLDVTNFVKLGIDSTHWTIKLKAGEVGYFRLVGTALWAIADTATCNLSYTVFSD